MTSQERYTKVNKLRLVNGGNLEEEIIGNHGFNIDKLCIRY